MEEAMAIQLVSRAGDQIYRYSGGEAGFHNETGRFELLDDMNCCAPTNSVLFAFVCGNRRKVMDAPTLLEFFEDCQIVEDGE